ncbi:MAG: hypothetical protein QXP36_00055 [Conexivisphaerales archaeon]
MNSIIKSKITLINILKMQYPNKAKYLSYVLESYIKKKISLEELESIFSSVIALPDDLILSDTFATSVVVY